MPTEAEVITWFAQHWPSLIIAGILAKAYLKLRSFVKRIERLENRNDRHRRICAKQHEDIPGHGVKIFDDGTAPEE